MGASYRFVSRWQVPSSPSRCWAVLEQGLREGAVAWWRGVELEAERVPPAVGDRLRMRVRSPLGYRLTVDLTITEVLVPSRLSAIGAGDLAGEGTLTIRPQGDGAVLTWLWAVEPQRRWMRVTSPLLRPVFAAAHAVIMRRGERGLARLLSR